MAGKFKAYVQRGRLCQAAYDRDIKLLAELFAEFDAEAKAWLDYLDKIQDIEVT